MKRGRISMERALARTQAHQSVFDRVMQRITPKFPTAEPRPHWLDLPPLTA